jgi:hypothetical protein
MVAEKVSQKTEDMSNEAMVLPLKCNSYEPDYYPDHVKTKRYTLQREC